MRPEISGVRAVSLLFAVVSLSACAGSTVNSGVGDRILDEPPYYAGRLLPVEGRTFAVMPIAYQRGSSQAFIFEPDAEPGSELALLLDAMNSYLADSLEVGAMLDGDSRLPGQRPDVMFRCLTDSFDECAFPEDGGDPQMRLAIARPSSDWASALGVTLDMAGAPYALMITLEFSDYWVQTRRLGTVKEVRLGTDRVVEMPFLTSNETPVSVLQLTGAILDREGKAVRIGAEGLLARRTRLLVSAIGGQETISDEDIAALESDVWKDGLRTLVQGLVGR